MRRRSVATILLVYLIAGLATPRGAYAGAADLKGCAYHFSKIIETITNPQIYFRLEWIDRFAYWLRLQKHKPKTTRVLARLSDLHPNHPIEARQAQEKTKERAERLRALRSDAIAKGKIEMAEIDRLMPSSFNMYVVRDKFGNLIVMEGCGRYFALQEAFADHPDLLVEVEYIDHGGDRSVTSALDRILRANKTNLRAPASPPVLLPVTTE